MLVACTRVLNEDDIIEAFVRHHAPTVDRFIFLDNGSTDGTLGILRALRSEGFALVVLQTASAQFFEVQHNTLLFHVAVQTYQADWVLFLDADEFIDARGLGLPVRHFLAALPADSHAVRMPLRNYYGGDGADLLVPRRMRLRPAEATGIVKCWVRGRLPPGNVLVDAGNHDVLLDGVSVPGVSVEALVLAHYPQRSAVQMLAKAVLGQLKVLAAGAREMELNRSAHYAPLMDRMARNPAELLGNPDFMRGVPNIPLIDDPIAYVGGPLTHTQPADTVMKAVASLASGAERLARQHGRLLDEAEGVRALVEAWSQKVEYLF